ncbi:PLP-dependent transferase, partial [Escherichia coli]|uniref:PLP-dependent transferase n=1 Tax=Escherichia coli TaxID=562 RepID=UPI001953618D
VPDSAYDPTRSLANGLLARMGVETSYYDPLIGAGIAALCRPNTRLVLLESPGSLTFEVQDVPAIVAVARERGIAT